MDLASPVRFSHAMYFATIISHARLDEIGLNKATAHNIRIRLVR